MVIQPCMITKLGLLKLRDLELNVGLQRLVLVNAKRKETGDLECQWSLTNDGDKKYPHRKQDLIK
jgi:hypothetical protein